MNRLEKALHFVGKSGLGLEIGPSHNPVAPKKEGYKVEIVDHATAAELREKYKGHPVNIDNIEEVDYVWKGEDLSELTGKQGYYDYIIASHVIEHITDVVNFLKQCELLLKPGGVLSLIVPDKRYCFDYFRWPSSTGDILDAYEERRVRHRPGMVFDHFANTVKMSGSIAWAPETLSGDFSIIHTFEQAKNLWQAASQSNEYIDVHAWRFTPASFHLILNDLRELGLIRLVEIGSFETEGCEFHIALGVRNDPCKKVDRLELLRQVVTEVRSGLACLERSGA